MELTKEQHERKVEILKLKKRCPEIQIDRTMLQLGHIGIDLFYLDDKLKVPNETSLANYLTKKYGKDFSNRVSNLI